MKIKYDVKVSIANKNNGTTSSFPAKILETDITAPTDALLYDNHHIIAKDVYLFDMFKDEVQTYSTALGVPVTDLEFDSFEVTALEPPTKYQVYFEFDGDKQKQDLRPTIKVYIAPKNKTLDRPVLKGTALDQNSILWSWDDDGCAHYLIIEAINPSDPNDKDKIIAQLPIGVSEYVEIGLEPGTAYTRRLISYTDEQYSEVSAPCTTWTETTTPDVSVKEYEIPRLYDFTIDESQREIIEERMKAFHSGIGDFLDLKVYKQMDADFYQKFKAYFEITGRRVQRERRYEQVGFNYKVCMDAMERIEEQEGEVTFDVYAYPREWLRLQDYVWATKDVTVQAEFEATVFLQKEESMEQDSPVNIHECEIEEVTDVLDVPGTWVWGTPGKYKYSIENTPKDILKYVPLSIILIIDVTGSVSRTCGYQAVSDGIKSCVLEFDKLMGEMDPDYKTVEEDPEDKDSNKLKKLGFALIYFTSSAKVCKNGAAYPSSVMLTANEVLKETTALALENKEKEFPDSADDTSWIAAFEKTQEVLGWSPPGTSICLFFTDGGPNAKSGKSAYKPVEGTWEQPGNRVGFPNNTDRRRTEAANYTYDATINAINTFKTLRQPGATAGSKKYEECISIVFEYKWGYDCRTGKKLSLTLNADDIDDSDVPGTTVDDIFKDSDGSYYNKKLCKNCIEKLKELGNDDCVIIWKNDNPGNVSEAAASLTAAFEKFKNRLIIKGTALPAETDEKEALAYEELPSEFKAKVNIAKAQSGRSDPVETATYTSPSDRYGWTREPSTSKKEGLYAEESDKTPKLSTSTDIPAENKPGGAHEGKWAPAPSYSSDTRKEFKGWGSTPKRIESVAKYNLDSMVAVTIKGGPYKYVFTNSESCTPVIYSRKEKRAIISKALNADPNRNYYVDSSGNKVMILDEILRLVKDTPEWRSGYQTLVKTSSGKIMIRGLFIKDNYTIGDDDIDYSRGWCNGMEGSVNSFTQIDHGESDSYGDDCYLVDANSVLQVQGYTDALIFDGEHAVSAELNAYDFPQVNAIHSNGSVVVDNNHDVPCNTFMFNRKDRDLQYDGSGPYSHCIDVVECDRDIILQGLDSLVEEEPSPDEDEDETIDSGQNIVRRSSQKYQVFDPMNVDIIGKIELWYRSPVLNYRFNIEDPDAKTSIYEILPDCFPEDNFLHVVLLHVYYARNVYITDGPNPESLNGTPQTRFNYIKEYGDNPIAYYGDPNLLDDNPGSAEGLYKWTLKMWQDTMHRDNGWYLDDFVWFQAEKMKKDIPYHDELPGNGIQPFYGLVNGRYTSKRQDGKQDLLVQVPQFNVPTTVMDYYKHYGHSDNPINWNGDGTHPMKIYIALTEFHPKDALVSYKWDKDCRWVNPATGRINDDVTQDYKGCYVTFSCDSVTYKDVEYYDLVETINFENQEVFDTKNNIIHYQLDKPETEYVYTNYYLKVSTDNSDVMALNYPGEIMFDESGHADFGVTYKGVVNATTKWAPRIHNGYYYLNQHEYFAYSEFEFDRVKTNVEHNDMEKCITVFGHMTFDVTLCHNAPPPEYYRGDGAIVKDGRSSLLQNENQFQWIDGLGLTLKPKIDGEYYKEYSTYMYYSPVLSFPHTLTDHGPITLDYTIGDGTDELMGVEIRSYILEDGKWSDWYPLAGVEVPCYPNHPYSIPTDIPLSHAYQVRFYLQASVKNEVVELEDYLCCYLDWKDDGEESVCYNIVTITDHMTTGPYQGKGIYVSKIFDFGCSSTMYLDMFQSKYKDKIKLYVASSIDKNDLYVENATWIDISNGGEINGRYIRYRIEIPEGEKLYWLHKKIRTKKTEAILPYVRGFKMEGEYHPGDIITNFINTEAFEIPADGTYHDLEEFSDITKIIGDDVLDRGYTMDEIKKVDIHCTTNNISISYNSNLLNEYPGASLKNTKLKAKAPYQSFMDINYTPFIFLDDDELGYDKITIYGATPQQYCPITVEDPEGLPYIQLHDSTDFKQTLTIVCDDKTKYIELPTNRYDYFSMKIKLNGTLLSKTKYKITNHLIIFNDFLSIGDTIEIDYYIMYSFIATIDRYGDNVTPPNTVIYLYTGYKLNADNEPEYIKAATKYKVFFETGLRNNKFVANRLSLNPIYRTDYKGFIYLTDDNNEPYTVKIYCNPRRIKAGGFDKVDVAVEVLDILGNPVINREVYLDCGATEDDSNSFDRGIINCENNMTDMNGVVHFIYESSVLPVEAKIRASVFNCAGASIEDSITIVNE